MDVSARFLPLLNFKLESDKFEFSTIKLKIYISEKVTPNIRGIKE